MGFERLRTLSVAPQSRRVAIAGLLAGLVVVGGCDRTDAVSQAIDDARRSLSAMHSGGVSPSSDDARLEAYANALQTLQTAASSGAPGQQSAAQVLIGHAHAGRGQIAASRATTLEHDALGRASIVRSMLEHTVLLRLQHANALESVSSVDQQAAVEAQVREVEAEESAKRADLRTMQDSMESLRQQAAQARAEANEHRATENELRGQAISAQGDSRADLIVRAVEAQRQADQAERRNADLIAQIAVLEPEIAQTERELQSLQTRITLLRDSRERMATRDESLRSSASDERSTAREAATDIDQALRQLDDFRENELASAYDEAIAAYQAAADSTRRAMSGAGNRSAVAIAMAGFLQSIGDLHRARATGLERYATVLQQAATAEAGLPARSTYEQFLARVQASRAEAESAALEAYAEAVDAFENAGARGDVGARVERLVQSMRGNTDAGEAIEDEGFVDDDATLDGSTDEGGFDG